MLVCTSAAGRITPEIGGRIMVRGDNGRERTAVIQVGPAAFTLGSRRAALKHGYTVLGRAAALAAK
jgi:hypothetical protein